MKTESEFTILIAADSVGTRWEAKGKPFAIFKKMFLIEKTTGNAFPVDGDTYFFSEFKENKNSDIMAVGELKSFASLQKAFDYAESKQLSFF